MHDFAGGNGNVVYKPLVVRQWRSTYQRIAHPALTGLMIRRGRGRHSCSQYENVLLRDFGRRPSYSDRWPWRGGGKGRYAYRHRSLGCCVDYVCSESAHRKKGPGRTDSETVPVYVLSVEPPLALVHALLPEPVHHEVEFVEYVASIGGWSQSVDAVVGEVAVVEADFE